MKKQITYALLEAIASGKAHSTNMYAYFSRPFWPNKLGMRLPINFGFMGFGRDFRMVPTKDSVAIEEAVYGITKEWRRWAP